MRAGMHQVASTSVVVHASCGMQTSTCQLTSFQMSLQSCVASSCCKAMGDTCGKLYTFTYRYSQARPSQGQAKPRAGKGRLLMLHQARLQHVCRPPQPAFRGPGCMAAWQLLPTRCTRRACTPVPCQASWKGAWQPAPNHHHHHHHHHGTAYAHQSTLCPPVLLIHLYGRVVGRQQLAMHDEETR